MLFYMKLLTSWESEPNSENHAATTFITCVRLGSLSRISWVLLPSAVSRKVQYELSFPREKLLRRSLTLPFACEA